MRQNKNQTNVYKFDLDGKLLAVYGNIVERRGDYIFIEKDLPANERCLQCGIYNTSLECPPCDKRDNERR